GGTTVNAGTVQVAGAGTLGSNAGALTLNALFFPVILDLGGTTQTQNGGVTLNGGTIQSGTLSSSGIFTLQKGIISAALAGTGSVTSSGAVTLSGANTYTGGTNVSAGTLQISGSGMLGSTAGAI